MSVDYNIEQIRRKKNDEAYNRAYEEKKLKALALLLKKKEFRFYMSDLLGFAGTFISPIDEKGSYSAIKAGKQFVGLKIFNDINLVSPEYYLKLVNEEKVALEEKKAFMENNGKQNGESSY